MRKQILLCLALVSCSANYRSPLAKAPPREAARSNPYEGLEQAARAGQKLYRRECTSCHGTEAQGAGRAPALTPSTLRQAKPGAIFWVLRNGSLGRGMPSFSHLPEQQRWQIITYLKMR